MANEPKQKPVKEFRFGAIKAAVWKRENEGKVFFSTSLSRSYRLEPNEREGATDEGWRETNSFDFTDLATVETGLQMAAKWIKQQLMDAV